MATGERGASLVRDRARACARWYDGAVAALMSVLLGMRASEIVTRTVRDLDEDDQPGDLLWIPDSKTEAGKRTLEVPEPLRPLLVARAEGKAPNDFIFPAEKGGAGRHWRDWVRKNVNRICKLAKVPVVTAHAGRGLLATLTAERGMAGHLVAATLGHADERTTKKAYAVPGSADTGSRRRGLKVLSGGKGR